MGLTAKQIQDYELKAEDLLQSTYGSLDKIQIPVDLNRVVRDSGMKILEGRLPDDVEGVLDRKAQAIYLKASSPNVRKKFTAAHELGHYWLHDDVNVEVFYRMDSMNLSADVEIEREANWFASSLLMPRQQVRQYWFLLRDVSKMADKFQVSITAMRWRLKNLGLLE